MYPTCSKRRLDWKEIVESTMPRNKLMHTKAIERANKMLKTIADEESTEMQVIKQKFAAQKETQREKIRDRLIDVPMFWVNALKHCPLTTEWMDDSHRILFSYCNNIEATGCKENKDLLFSFYFDANPYFENALLRKMYLAANHKDIKSISCVIRWKEGHDVSEWDNNRHSFFTWFHDDTTDVEDDDAADVLVDILHAPSKFFYGGVSSSSSDSDRNTSDMTTTSDSESCGSVRSIEIRDFSELIEFNNRSRDSSKSTESSDETNN